MTAYRTIIVDTDGSDHSYRRVAHPAEHAPPPAPAPPPPRPPRCSWCCCWPSPSSLIRLWPTGSRR